MLSFIMSNPETKESVNYRIYCDYIEAISNNENVMRFSKPEGKDDNEVIMDLMNHLIEQGCIVSELNLI